MALPTMIVGVLLGAIGAGGFWWSDGASTTALIPAFFGLPIIGLGALARRESLRKHAMHVAAVLGLLGLVGSAPGLLKLGSLFAGSAERPLAVASQSLMAVVCAVFLALCIRSFIIARRSQNESSAPVPT